MPENRKFLCIIKVLFLSVRHYSNAITSVCLAIESRHTTDLASVTILLFPSSSESISIGI
jgi:hypothetical protein